MRTDADKWLDIAEHLGIKVITPFEIQLSGQNVGFTALFPEFGAQAGMVVDADWKVIAPHKDNLVTAGFGYSCVKPSDTCDTASLREMLTDWGWSSSAAKPDWFQD